MHRVIAKLLLMLVAVGNLAPGALAAKAEPAHACCIRKTVHHCDGSGEIESAHLVIRGASCCQRNSGRALSTARWADSRASTTFSPALAVEPHVALATTTSPIANASAFHPSRAPPHFSI